jgi:hypothetical protein
VATGRSGPSYAVVFLLAIGDRAEATTTDGKHLDEDVRRALG